jgi:hypothetical protein
MKRHGFKPPGRAFSIIAASVASMHGSRRTRGIAVETCQSTSTRPSGDAGTQCIGSTSVDLAATTAGHMAEAQGAGSEWMRMAFQWGRR